MRHYTLDSLSFEMPSSYGELSYGQYLALTRMLDPEDKLHLLSILSKIPIEIFQESEDLFIFEKIQDDGTFDFLNEKFAPENFLLPQKIEINGVWYPMPEGIGLNSTGQKITFQRYIDKSAKEGKPEPELFGFVVALYMQPAVTNSKYDIKEVEKLQPDIDNCRISEVWPLASFFLINYERSLNLSIRDYRTRRPAKKSELVLKSSNDLGKYQRFGLWRRPLIKLLMKFSWSRTILSI